MQQVKTWRCFSAVGWGLWTPLGQGAELLAECLGDAGPAAAPLLLLLLPHPVVFFFSWALAWHNPSPWFCSVPQDAAAATTDNKPSPSACGSIRGAATAFPHETDSSASHWHGDLLCKGLVLYKP